MGGAQSELLQSVRALVEEYRDTCLWFLPVDYYPETADQIRRSIISSGLGIAAPSRRRPG